MNKSFSAKIITLPEVYDISFHLANQIIESSSSFDIIIAIARGGVTPARLFFDFLNINHLTSLQIRHYTSGAEKLEKAEIIDPVDMEIQGKNVLVVDDVNDTGKTLMAAVDHIQLSDPALLKTAVLHEKKPPASTPTSQAKYWNNGNGLSVSGLQPRICSVSYTRLTYSMQANTKS